MDIGAPVRHRKGGNSNKARKKGRGNWKRGGKRKPGSGYSNKLKY